MMRPFLVTQFYCSECGGGLDLTYQEPKTLDHISDGITGGSKVELKVFVEPCRKCRKPVDDVHAALKTLLSIGASK